MKESKRELFSIGRNEIENVEWTNTKQQLAYPMTKSGANTKLLLNTIITGSISVSDPWTTVIHILLYYMTQNNGQNNSRLALVHFVIYKALTYKHSFKKMRECQWLLAFDTFLSVLYTNNYHSIRWVTSNDFKHVF